MKSTGANHAVEGSHHGEAIPFPKPKRDWQKEKEEFFGKFLAAQSH
jgi:hypothetical protein